jgi:hypothetical protein
MELTVATTQRARPARILGLPVVAGADNPPPNAPSPRAGVSWWAQFMDWLRDNPLLALVDR